MMDKEKKPNKDEDVKAAQVRRGWSGAEFWLCPGCGERNPIYSTVCKSCEQVVVIEE